VAERLTARPGEAAYGPLTLLVAFWMAERRAGRLLPPGAFWPPPRVASRVVHLTPGKPLGTFEEYLRYRDWVKRLFRSRRKQLRGLLRQTLGEARSREALERLGWDPRSRCSDLAPLDYLHLARLFALDFSP
jgi:16S rRNA (adenine1518-N6/adenine1519-N6)-dimethyltransferase